MITKPPCDRDIAEDLNQAEQVMNIYRDLDEQTANFKQVSGLKCQKGCGRCCLYNQVEATPGEWLPLVLHLAEHGGLDNAYLKAQAARHESCVMFQKDPSDHNKGHCTVYPHRPSICRLFGFSTIKNKLGQKALLTCATIKGSFTKTLEGPVDLAPAPNCQEFQREISGVFATHPTLSATMPINRALAVAIEFVGLRLSLRSAS